MPDSIIPEIEIKDYVANLTKNNIEKKFDVIKVDSDNKEKEKDVKQLTINDYFISSKK